MELITHGQQVFAYFNTFVERFLRQMFLELLSTLVLVLLSAGKMFWIGLNVLLTPASVHPRFLNGFCCSSPCRWGAFPATRFPSTQLSMTLGYSIYLWCRPLLVEDVSSWHLTNKQSGVNQRIRTPGDSICLTFNQNKNVQRHSEFWGFYSPWDRSTKK